MSKILVVNDEADINTTVRHVLEDRGFKVDSYEDHLVALKNFKPQYYDLIIIDSKMPRINGFAFYREVKKMDKRIKTCFLTAARQLNRLMIHFALYLLTALYEFLYKTKAAGPHRGDNGSGKMISISIGGNYWFEV